MRVYLESEITHHLLVLILENGILSNVAVEEPVEDGMLEQIVPANPMLLLYLQALADETLGVLTQSLVNLEWLGLNRLHQLIFALGSPGSVPVQHLVKNAPDGPDVAFGSVAHTL